MHKAIGILILTVFLAGCTEGHVDFPVNEAAQDSLPEGVTVIRLSSANITSYARPDVVPPSQSVPDPQVWNYKVGIGDILSIDVFDHPELTLPAGPQRSAAESGFRVQADGTFFYPFVGQVKALGRAPEQIREDLRTKLAQYIPDPQLEVRVAAFNSQAIVVTGEVGAPNRQPLTTVPLTVLEAINAAGGFSDTADPARVTLQRQGKIYNINLEQFLSGDLLRNNPILRSGDVVYVTRSPIGKWNDTITRLLPSITVAGGLDDFRE